MREVTVTIGGQVLAIPTNPQESVLIEGFTVEENKVTKFGRIEVLQPGVRGWLHRLKREAVWPAEEARRVARRLAHKLAHIL